MQEVLAQTQHLDSDEDRLKQPLRHQRLEVLVHLLHPPGGAQQSVGFKVGELAVLPEIGVGDQGLGSGVPASAITTLAC